MTMPQAMEALGVKPESDSRLPSKSEEQRGAERAATLDAVCAKHGLTPAELGAIPAERVAEMVKAEGYAMVDAKQLAGWMREYVVTAGQRTARP